MLVGCPSYFGYKRCCQAKKRAYLGEEDETERRVSESSLRNFAFIDSTACTRDFEEAKHAFGRGESDSTTDITGIVTQTRRGPPTEEDFDDAETVIMPMDPDTVRSTLQQQHADADAALQAQSVPRFLIKANMSPMRRRSGSSFNHQPLTSESRASTGTREDSFASVSTGNSTRSGRPLAESATVSRSASLRPAVQMTAPPQLSHEEIHSQPSLSPAGTLSAYSRATSISRTSSSRPTTTPPPQVSHEMANTQPQSSLPHQAPQPKYSSATLVSRNPSPHPSVTPVRRVSHEEKSQQPDTSSKGLQSNDSDDFYKHSSDGPRRRGSSQTTWSEGLGDSGRSINIQVTQHASQPISAPVPTRPSQDGAPPPFMTTSAPPATPPPPVPHSRKSMTQ